MSIRKRFTTRHSIISAAVSVVIVLMSMHVLSVRLLADPLDFTLIPGGGALTGFPGIAAGWGYRLENNDASNWYEIVNLAADPFISGSAVCLFDFPIISPSTFVSQGWVLDTAGIYQFTFDPGTPVGTVNAGNFTLIANIWTDDPFSPQANLLGSVDISQPYSVAAIPEPTTICLVVSGILALHYAKRRIRRNM